MPKKDKEAQKLYLKQWKEAKRRSLGVPPRVKLTEDERKERRLASRKKYVEKNNDKVNSWKRVYTKNHPEKRLLWSAKKRAKEQGLAFNLEECDIVIPTHCPYLGIELVTNAKRGEPRTSVYSLDKINPELGYVKGNVEVISHLANTMKSNATEEQLLAFAQTIIKRYGEIVT